MTQLCCSPCGLRISRASAAPAGRCPRCAQPLAVAESHALVGYRLWIPNDGERELPTAAAAQLPLHLPAP